MRATYVRDDHASTVAGSSTPSAATDSPKVEWCGLAVTAEGLLDGEVVEVVALARLYPVVVVWLALVGQPCPGLVHEVVDQVCSAYGQAVARADEQIAEAEGRRWLDNPVLAARLDQVRRWREAHATSPLLEVLGRPDGDIWSVGQDFALGQVLAHLHAGDVLIADVDLATAGISVPSLPALRAALGPDAGVHSNVDGEAFLRLPGRSAPVRQLWAPNLPKTRSLSRPLTIPLLLGQAAPSAVLGELRARTAVARWPAGHRSLAVLLVRDLTDEEFSAHGAHSFVLHTVYPAQPQRGSDQQ